MRKIVRIRHAEYAAAISTTGANCISLTCDKKQTGQFIDILHSPKNEKDEKDFVFGIPLLFPPNRIDGGEFEFDGRRYIFPVSDRKNFCSLHGNINEEEFQIIDKRENSVSLSVNKDFFGEVFQPFSIIVNYALGGDGLRQTVIIKNRSDKNMPLAVGFHTSFNIPFTDNGNVEDIRITAVVKKEIERNDRYLPTGKSFEIKSNFVTVKPSDFISRVYEAHSSGKIVFEDGREKISVTYSPDEKFLFRVLFNGGRREFFCAEVQTCNVNACKTQKKEDGFRFILPKAEETFVSYIKAEIADCNLMAKEENRTDKTLKKSIRI